MNNEFDPSSITSETSFWQLYKLCRKIPSSKDNLIVFWLSLGLFSLGYTWLNVTSALRLELLNDLSSNLIAWSVSLLAFILAGYSIFASSASKSMQVAMERFDSKDDGMSHLKKIHCIFLKICIDILLVVFILFITSLTPFHDVMKVVNNSIASSVLQASIMFDLLLAFQSSLFVLVLMLSKSFIFNLFHSVMTTVRWEAEIELSKDEQNSN